MALADPATIPHLVAAEVRALMARHRRSQAQIAAVLGMTQTAVSRRLHGTPAFTIAELVRLADHFDVPLASLIPVLTDDVAEARGGAA